MKILVSDYSGHPFQVQLSRVLARRGHQVRHISVSSFQTPKGRLAVAQGDPSSFESVTVSTKEVFAKHNFWRRRGQEVEIGLRIGEQIAAFQPDVVLSSNAPLDTQRQILKASERANSRFVFWLQDIYSEAISRILRAKLSIAGWVIGEIYKRMEAAMLRRSHHVIVIADDFAPEVMKLAGVPAARITTIENWAPLDEIPLFERDTPYTRERLPDAPFRMIYSGTLGLKHNPGLLAALARAKLGELVVFSEGPAAEWLKSIAETEGLTNLHVSGWLDFEELPQALAGADALVVIIEPSAGLFSVPSKVLTYMAVGRPILGAMPKSNLAARILGRTGSGLVVEPTDEAGLVEAAKQLALDAERRRSMGCAARAYAEAEFDIAKIAAKFEGVLEKAHEG